MTDVERELVEASQALRAELAEWRDKCEQLKVELALVRAEMKIQKDQYNRLNLGTNQLILQYSQDREQYKEKLEQAEEELAKLRNEMKIQEHSLRSDYQRAAEQVIVLRAENRVLRKQVELFKI